MDGLWEVWPLTGADSPEYLYGCRFQMTAVPGPEQQQLVRRGEGAVVAEALNDVMGRMLTVVSKKTQVRFTLSLEHTRLTCSRSRP